MTQIDVLKDKILEIKLYEGKGYVILLDCMPRVLEVGKSTADYAIAQMARTSYGKQSESKSDKEDSGLIEYLIENYHTSPIEGIKFKFLIQCPIFVARQLIRHRTAQINEYSMRYSKAIDDFYFPPLRIQHPLNKQQSMESKEVGDDISLFYKATKEKAVSLIKDYEYLTNSKIAREVARSILCTAEMTKLVWCMDAHNLFKFLKLRCDRDHAQTEIADLADAIFTLIKQVIPKTCEVVENYWINSVTFSAKEMDLLRQCVDVEKLKGLVKDEKRKNILIKKLALVTGL